MAVRQILIAGNAIVDILTRINDDFLEKHGLIKGAMHLVDLKTWKQVYKEIGQTVEMSGGSGANSAAALANLGADVAFIGSVASDGFGKIFCHDLRALNVKVMGCDQRDEEKDCLGTGRSLILTSSDSERSMLTYLGAAQKIMQKDLSQDLLNKMQLFYLEGYLWDSLCAREALKKAMDLVGDKIVALSLSDACCVERHKNDFRDLICEKKVQIIFGNHSELTALYKDLKTKDEAVLRAALQKEIGLFACITDGPKGAYLITPKNITLIPPHKEEKKVIDTTGAGDLFAAGVLYGYCHGFSLEESAKFGAFCGSLIVQQMGTRYLGDLQKEARKCGFNL